MSGDDYDDLTVDADVEIKVTLAKPYDKEDVVQAVQDELGHTGAVVLDVSY